MKTAHTRDLATVAEPQDYGMDPANMGRFRRRVGRFRRAGLLGASDGVTQVQRATTAKDLRQAYALVHDVFVEKGFIDRQTGGVRLRAFEALPEMATFVAKHDERVVAVMSILPDSPDLGLPSDEAFRDELDQMRLMGRHICEITNLAIEEEFRNTTAFFDLTRCCLAEAMAVDCDELFIAISPEHCRFFQGVLQFVLLGEPRSYSATKEDIVQGMALNLVNSEQRARQLDEVLGPDACLHDFLFAKNEYHDRVGSWARQARRAFDSPMLLADLFVLGSDLLSRCGPRELAAIRSRWGADYADITGALAPIHAMSA